MTFDPKSGSFSCDSCPESIECDGRTDFTGCLIYAKAQGWRTYKGPDQEYAHACSACCEDWKKEQRR